MGSDGEREKWLGVGDFTLPRIGAFMECESSASRVCRKAVHNSGPGLFSFF